VKTEKSVSEVRVATPLLTLNKLITMSTSGGKGKKAAENKAPPTSGLGKGKSRTSKPAAAAAPAAIPAPVYAQPKPAPAEKPAERRPPRTNQEETSKYDYPERTNISDSDVKLGMASWVSDRLLITSLVVIVVAFSVVFFSSRAYRASGEIQAVLQEVKELYERNPKNTYIVAAGIVGAVASLVYLATVYFLVRKRPVYLLDFAVYTPADDFAVSYESFLHYTTKSGHFDSEALTFQEKLLRRTGLGPKTYFPPGILGGVEKGRPSLTMQDARDEAAMVMFGSLNELFEKTGVHPQMVDILIVNCSLFNPTPSLASMIINRYKLRSDIKSLNLAGMGCSAGLISIDLAKDLLQVHRNAIAIVVSTENITQNWYRGAEKSMLVPNTLFRMGCAAIMLTNRSNLRSRAKYSLHCTVRTHRGADDKAYNSIYQCEDPLNTHVGVRLAPAKDLMDVMAAALKANMTTLGPMVLPITEQAKFVINYIRRQFLKHKVPTYIPDFRKAFQHFCIHAGGRAIIDGLEQNLKLEPHHVEPSRATLYRYGNTSSSSVWYELAFIERKGSMRVGDKIWQIAVGSGFKCNSAVWKCIATRGSS
jgi:3-ketoacyl-CoA synthase